MKRNRMSKKEKLQEIKEGMIRNILAYNKCFKEHVAFFQAKNYVQLLAWVHPIDLSMYKEEIRNVETSQE
jgi:hypothetical protein